MRIVTCFLFTILTPGSLVESENVSARVSALKQIDPLAGEMVNGSGA